MASQYTIQKRNLKWYQEDNEQPLGSERMREGYEPSRLKAGSDGKNVDSVTKGYATNADREFDDMGASKGKKTGKTNVVEAKKPVTKATSRVKEEEEFEDDTFGMEGEGDLGLDTEMGEPMGEPEGDEIVDDITITVGGQTYKLVPDMEAGLEGGEGDIGDDETFEDDMAMGAEEDDVTQPKFESKKKANKVLDKAVEARAKKLLSQKAMIEKKLAELFTGSYVASDSGAKPVQSGETDFAVGARANSGKQYTPTVNPKTAFEPETDNLSSPKSRAPDNQIVKTAEAKKAEFKKWLAEKEKALKEDDTDAGQDSVDFNKNDTQDNFIGDEFADTPIEVGGEDDQIHQYGENSKKKNGREALEESFDFKKLMRGEYR